MFDCFVVLCSVCLIVCLFCCLLIECLFVSVLFHLAFVSFVSIVCLFVCFFVCLFVCWCGLFFLFACLFVCSCYRARYALRAPRTVMRCMAEGSSCTGAD